MKIQNSITLTEQKGIKGVVLGKSGIGKTSLLWSLDPETTLFINLEGGDLAVQGWQGKYITPETWQDCRHIAAFLGGADKSLENTLPYSEKHYNSVAEKLGELSDYETIFVDSITVAARLCFRYSSMHPANQTKAGVVDTRAVYGMQGKEMLAWLTQFQRAICQNIWFVGILEEKYDEMNRVYYAMQAEGQKTGLELPGIVDEVITMTALPDRNKELVRCFVCHTINPYNLPAKDRSGHLNMLEPAHLGDLMNKIKMSKNTIVDNLKYGIPA